MKSDFYINKLNNLKWTDVEWLAKNSVFNHHVNGMNYLCIERSPAITYKIYYCNGVGNPNGGYLVHPHNHRYNFHSTVLKGELQHLRFKESESHGELVTKNRYNWQTKELDTVSKICIYPHRDDNCKANDSYYVEINETHTLKLISPVVIIGLSQYEDKTDDAFLYKHAQTQFKIPDSYTPSVEQYLQQYNEIRWHLGL